MAKVTTTTCKKFRRTVHIHGISTPLLLGSLELIWQAAASRQGDSFEPWEIESIAEWDGEPNALLNALVLERWLDPEFGPDGELIECRVHDFGEHCPRYVKGMIARKVTKQTTELPTEYRTQFPTELPTESMTELATTNTNTNTNTNTKDPKEDLVLSGITTLRGGAGGDFAASAAVVDDALPEPNPDPETLSQPKARSTRPEFAPVVNGEGLLGDEQENHPNPELERPTINPVQEFFDAWNSSAAGKFTQAVKLTPDRRQKILTRMRDPWWRDNWRAGIEAVSASEFHCGHNDRRWCANMDWFLKPGTLAKMLEAAANKPIFGKQYSGDVDGFGM